MRNIASSSSAESCQEDYKWTDDKNFPNEEKKDFLKYPINKWKNIIYDKDFSKSQFTDKGIYFQKIVDKILKEDLFKGFEFYRKKDGRIKFKFNEVDETYSIFYQSISKDFIAPDFFVYHIPTQTFLNLLQSRNYILICKNKISINQEFINILGEIKSTLKSVHKNTKQREDYIKFFQRVNNLKTGEFIVLMYIYAQSFYIFKDEKNYKLANSEDNLPLIYGYIPKLYYENCY